MGNVVSWSCGGRHKYLVQLPGLCPVICDVGIFRTIGLRSGARAGRSATVNLHDRSLDGDAGRTDIHKATGPDERDLHAGFDDDLHSRFEVDFLSHFQRIDGADLFVPLVSDLKGHGAVDLLHVFAFDVTMLV